MRLSSSNRPSLSSRVQRREEKVRAFWKVLLVSVTIGTAVASAAAPAFASTGFADTTWNHYMTYNGSGGDLLVHASGHCAGCNDQQIDLVPVSGGVVRCSDSNGWWPFTIHAFDTNRCGDAVVKIHWPNENDGNYAAAITTGADIFGDATSGDNGTNWVVTNQTGFINVYTSDQLSAEYFFCSNSTSGGDALLEQWTSGSGCNWAAA